MPSAKQCLLFYQHPPLFWKIWNPSFWESLNFKPELPSPFPAPPLHAPLIKERRGWTTYYLENVIYNALLKTKAESIPKQHAIEFIDQDVAFLDNNDHNDAKQYHFSSPSIYWNMLKNCKKIAGKYVKIIKIMLIWRFPHTKSKYAMKLLLLKWLNYQHWAVLIPRLLMKFSVNFLLLF